MLCCFPSWKEPPSSTYQRQTSDDGYNYPGRRREKLAATGGNALAEPSPLATSGEPQYAEVYRQQSPAAHQHQQQLQQQQQQSAPSSTVKQQQQQQQQGGQMISVTVPSGVRAGQAIHVMAPDGSGRLIEARVPQGMSAGSTFMIQAPSSTSTPSLPMAEARILPPPHAPPHDYSSITPLEAPPKTNARPEPRPFSMALDDADDDNNNNNNHHYYTTSPQSSPTTPSAPYGQKLLLVNVPPGVPVGSMLHVQVPNEPGRLLQAQVPSGNVSSFHVAYTPNSTGDGRGPPPPPPPPPNNNSYHRPPPMNMNAAFSNSGGGFASSSSSAAMPKAPPGQKLVLVRVPPGVAPGSMLHVQVPNEPGRLLQAQVPSGNISEFHVAYTPNVVSGRGGGGHQHQQQHQQPSRPGGHYQQQQQQYNRPQYNNNNNTNNGGGGFGSAVVPMVGGLAAGLGAAMAYDHFAHHTNTNTNDYDNGGGDDYGGDGGDF